MASTVRAQDAERPVTGMAGVTATDLLLLCMSLIWGINYAVVKFGTGAFPPLTFNAARMTLAVTTLSVMTFAAGYRIPRGRDLVRLLALGALGNGVYQVLFVEGISRTRAGDAALLVAASPALMAIIGRVRGSERTGFAGVIGILLSLTGIALVVFGQPGGGAGATSIPGDTLILAGTICWAFYTVLLKPLTERIEGVPLSLVTLIGGLIPMLCVAAPSIARTPWTSVGRGGWLAVLYSGLLAMALAYLFWYRGVRTLGPTRTAMYANLQPVIALAVAWATLGETPRLAQITGAALIMAGLVLTRMNAHVPPCE